MTVNQIYSTINDIAENMTEGKTHVIDTSSFVNFGTLVLSSATNKEKFYNQLVDRIGRTVFAIREYQRQNRNVTVDSFTFGCILQKVSYKMQDAENNSSWDVNATNPYTLTPKQGVIQKLFAQDLPTFSYTDVILTRQLESAFIKPENMASFFNGLYIRMRNALEVDLEGMDNYAIASLVAEVNNEVVTDSTNARRARNLLAEYKTIHTSSTLTEDTCLDDKDFLEFVCVEIGTVIPFLGKLTTMYNNGEVERVSKPDDLVVEVSSIFEKKYNVYLKSNTYHDEMVNLPNFNAVPYWIEPTTPMNIKVGAEEEAKEIKNVICIMRDKDAVVDTLEFEKFSSMYDDFNERTYIKLSADRRYIVDTSENCVFFYVADVEDTEQI